MQAIPNALVTFSSSSSIDDPLFPNQWNLPIIKVIDAWDIVSGSSEIVVAVIDLGVNISHEDLTNQLWMNPGEIYDGIDNDGNGYVDDIHGVNIEKGSGKPDDLISSAQDWHGTRVAGVVVAETANGKGIAGFRLGRNAAVKKIMLLK